LSLGGRSRSGAQVTSWISSENHRSHSSLQAHRANPLDHAQDGQGAGSPRQHCGANLAGARTQTSPAKELQTVTGPEVRRKASGKDRKVSSAAGGNLSRMHKTQETAKESRLNFMYSHLRNRTLAGACCEMSRRDGAIVAWHEVPGTAPPQRSRPVGYGVIRAGVRTNSMIGVTKFRMRKLKKFMLYDFWPTIQFFIQRWYLAGSGNGPLHRAAARTSSDTNLSRRVFSLP